MEIKHQKDHFNFSAPIFQTPVRNDLLYNNHRKHRTRKRKWRSLKRNTIAMILPLQLLLLLIIIIISIMRKNKKRRKTREGGEGG